MRAARDSGLARARHGTVRVRLDTLDLVLLPVSLCEGFLRWQITFGVGPDAQAQSALAG